jgi:diguanylate cyclase (GGDEF)-like protein
VTWDRAQAVALAERGGRDSLTGLARRSVLTAHVEGLVRKRKSFAVLFMDLDGFKAVNDTMGHKAGDLVLENVARALRGSTRAGDLAVRLGGDEFAVILAESTNPEDAAKRLLSKVLEVTEPFGAGASVGVAIYPQHGGTLDELLAAADVAMYRAKKVRGGDVVEVAEA